MPQPELNAEMSFGTALTLLAFATRTTNFDTLSGLSLMAAVGCFLKAGYSYYQKNQLADATRPVTHFWNTTIKPRLSQIHIGQTPIQQAGPGFIRRTLGL